MVLHNSVLESSTSPDGSHALHFEIKIKSPNTAQSKHKIHFTGRLFSLSYEVGFTCEPTWTETGHVNENKLIQ